MNAGKVFIEYTYEQIDVDYEQTGGTKMPHQLLSRTVAVRQAGYVFIYLSNEGTTQQDVYFDDASYTHIKVKAIPKVVTIKNRN